MESGHADDISYRDRLVSVKFFLAKIHFFYIFLLSWKSLQKKAIQSHFVFTNTILKPYTILLTKNVHFVHFGMPQGSIFGPFTVVFFLHKRYYKFFSVTTQTSYTILMQRQYILYILGCLKVPRLDHKLLLFIRFFFKLTIESFSRSYTELPESDRYLDRDSYQFSKSSMELDKVAEMKYDPKFIKNQKTKPNTAAGYRHSYVEPKLRVEPKSGKKAFNEILHRTNSSVSNSGRVGIASIHPY